MSAAAAVVVGLISLMMSSIGNSPGMSTNGNLVVASNRSAEVLEATLVRLLTLIGVDPL